MTIQEFFDALTGTQAASSRPDLVPESARQMLHLTSRAGDEHCPITAVCEYAAGQALPPTAVS